MTLLFFLNKLFSLAVIAGQIGVALAIAYFALFRHVKNVVTEFLGRHGMLLAFLVALGSVAGSLFYSEIAGFTPCDLCWFQRIFMYPLVFLLGWALIKKDRTIIDYALALSVLGGLISLYHNYMYYYNGGLNAFCQLSGAQISCIKRYVFEFGYVTIPLMALTAFLVIIIFLVLAKLGRKNNS